VTFNIQTQGIVTALNRIADGIDRISPPVDLERQSKMKKRGPEAIIRYGDDTKQWKSETFANLIHERGLAPAREQELLDKVMAESDEDDPDLQGL
jgi:hypothetical protein